MTPPVSADGTVASCPVALIHPASAGHGLNLQSGGSAIVWFGLTWSLELYQQTVARLWRQGQTFCKTVVVQHIVTKGTIDERIMKTLSQKGAYPDGADRRCESGLENLRQSKKIRANPRIKISEVRI